FRAETVNGRRRQARGLEKDRDSPPSPLDVLEDAEDAFGRASQLLAHLLARVRWSLADPPLVLLRELDVGLTEIRGDVLDGHLGEGEQHGSDQAGPVFTRKAMEQHTALG